MYSQSVARSRACVVAVVAILGAVASASCAGDTAVAADSATPASLTIVQGSNQAVQGGKELPNAVVLRVLTEEGKPVEKVTVGFTVTTGGGSVNPGSAVTDANGEARTKWILGPSDPDQKLKAEVAGISPVTISATAIVPSAIIIAQGNNQSARVSAALVTPIVIRVVGINNTPIIGVPVAFQITAGAGVITPQSALTNAFGEVNAKWTLGPTAGANSLAATVANLAPAIVMATGTP
jgi:type II secretory pathway pseudopilin PulG